jgi:hypothetical protein
MTLLKGFSLIINVQDEDWTLFDPEDPERGWSRVTYHFATRDAIRNFFISGFEGSSNQYLNEICYALREKALGKYLVPMTKERAIILHKTQNEFLDKMNTLELNDTYEISNSIYFVILPLVVRLI